MVRLFPLWLLLYYLLLTLISNIQAIDDSHPYLYLFALSIPEVWALISFGTFFTDVSVIVWQSPNKGWIVKVRHSSSTPHHLSSDLLRTHAKAGSALAAAFFLSHLIAFGLLFRQQGSLEIHPPPDQDASITSPSLSSNHMLMPRSPSPLSESPIA